MDTRMNEIKLTQVQLSLQHGGSELFFILEIVTVFDGIYWFEFTPKQESKTCITTTTHHTAKTLKTTTWE